MHRDVLLDELGQVGRDVVEGERLLAEQEALLIAKQAGTIAHNRIAANLRGQTCGERPNDSTSSEGRADERRRIQSRVRQIQGKGC